MYIYLFWILCGGKNSVQWYERWKAYTYCIWWWCFRCYTLRYSYVPRKVCSFVRTLLAPLAPNANSLIHSLIHCSAIGNRFSFSFVRSFVLCFFQKWLSTAIKIEWAYAWAYMCAKWNKSEINVKLLATFNLSSNIIPIPYGRFYSLQITHTHKQTFVRKNIKLKFCLSNSSSHNNANVLIETRRRASKFSFLEWYFAFEKWMTLKRAFS